MSEDQLEEARVLVESGSFDRNRAARRVRNSTNGALLIYPISRYSGYHLTTGERRQRLYENPDDALASGIIGIALSFPRSDRAQTIRGEYVIGTVAWRPL